MKLKIIMQVILEVVHLFTRHLNPIQVHRTLEDPLENTFCSPVTTSQSDECLQVFSCFPLSFLFLAP